MIDLTFGQKSVKKLQILNSSDVKGLTVSKVTRARLIFSVWIRYSGVKDSDIAVSAEIQTILQRSLKYGYQTLHM